MFRAILVVLFFLCGNVFGQSKAEIVDVDDNQLVIGLGKAEKLSGFALIKASETEYKWDALKLPDAPSVSLQTANGHRIEVEQGKVTLRIKKPFMLTYFQVGETYFYLKPEIKKGELVGYKEAKSVSKQELDKLQENGKVVIISIGADWCPPCHKQRPITYYAISQTKTPYYFVDFDGDDEFTNLLKTKYEVKTIPRTLVFQGHTLIESLEGMVSDELILSAISQDEAYQKRKQRKILEAEKAAAEKAEAEKKE